MLISRKSKNLNILLLCGVLVCALSSCYENVMGCLDPDSANYDVTADEECDDCCTYPQLSLLVAHVFEEDPYNGIDTVTNDIGQMFVIEDAQTYFSNIRLNTETDAFGIAEKITYTDNNGEPQEITDDIELVRRSGFRYPLGTLATSEVYTSLNLSLGVPNVIDEANSIDVENGHPLTIAGDSLYIVDQNQYVKSWMLIRQIGVHDIADTLQIAGSGYEYTIGGFELTQQRGASINFNIKIDYSEVMKGLDYNAMTKSEIAAKIRSNYESALSLNF